MLYVIALLSAAAAAEPMSWADQQAAGLRPMETVSLPAPPSTVVIGATVLTAAGDRWEGGWVLLRDGRIADLGTGAPPSADRVIQAQPGWFVTPGIIDTHSHLGVYPSPDAKAHSDGNEMTGPVTPGVWAEHGVWPADPGFQRAVAGGVTTLQVLPGSANLIGGRGVVLRPLPTRGGRAMRYPGAPETVKMACGENPKRVYGNRRTLPSTRMGNVASWRQSWSEAVEYQRDWTQFEARRASGAKDLRAPKRDLRMETMAAVLRGEVLVQNHCYRADEMAIVLDMAKEFGYKVSSFHHATEAYKIADLLAEQGVCAAVWADWWGFKMESYDAIPENMVIVDAAKGGCAIVHSDSDEGIQRLNQEAAKGIAAAARAGISIKPEHAVRWITQNPARALGIADKTGTLEVGKAADVVVWNGDPFSVYALAEKVFIDGATRFDRSARRMLPESDFMLGQPAAPGVSP
jgi:imidazolonepropionase-like amidohydrolase